MTDSLLAGDTRQMAEALTQGEFLFTVAGQPRRVNVLAALARMRELAPDWEGRFAAMAERAAAGGPLTDEARAESLRELLGMVRATRTVLDLPEPTDDGHGVATFDALTIVGMLFAAAGWLSARKAG